MRMFDQHEIRQTQSLDGPWELYFPKTGTAIDVQDWRSGSREVLDIPGVWEQLESRRTYRGQAVARRTFTCPRSGPALLVFKGVSHTARVYLDGAHVATHHNAFTPFTIEIPHLSEGNHELLVHISNAHGDISGLHVPNDYYNYGGVNRPVVVQYLGNRCLIDRVHVTTALVDGRWSASCKVHLSNIGSAAVEGEISLSLAGAERTVAFVCERGVMTLDIDLAPGIVTPWCPRTPRLYQLEAKMTVAGIVVDDWRDRIGFRTVATKDQQLLLNGKPVFLAGFNRHEDHPDFGCAISVPLMRRDLLQMKDLGCNAVRTSHYPNDERFLDLCDEMGFLVWEENHARGQNVQAMLHPRFREQCYAVTGEMVYEHFNRPCIVMWGIMNECASESAEGREMYKEQFELIRSIDESRPTTYASCRHGNDMCQDLPDICGWNVYPNWYGNQNPRACIDELIERYEPQGMADKPFIISETGGGAIPGFHDPVRRGKWSEERQADILEELLREYLSHPRVCGLFIWQFCDVRVAEEWANGRPRTMNNKGVVDEYRRHKLAYPVVQRHFREKLAGWANEDACG